MTTKELERKLYNAVARGKNGFYMAFEVAMPYEEGIVRLCDRERVDALLLETHGWNYDGGIWRCYELKVSKADFHSKAALSWYGHYNYYVMPHGLYEQVKDEIPDGIGVYTARDNDLLGMAVCVKKPKKRELKIPHHKLVFALMQRLAREYQKNVRVQEEE